jgi:hypothetical protein
MTGCTTRLCLSDLRLPDEILQRRLMVGSGLLGCVGIPLAGLAQFFDTLRTLGYGTVACVGAENLSSDSEAHGVGPGVCWGSH